MMNDRFSAQLRQHLLETADERPADGRLEAIDERVAVTAQRPQLVARLGWFPGRVDPFASGAVRFALIAAALIVAIVAAALAAGVGSPSASGAFGGKVEYQLDGGPATTEVDAVADGVSVSGTAVTTFLGGTHTVRLGCAAQVGGSWLLGGTVEKTTVYGESAGPWSAVIVKDGSPQHIGIWLSAGPEAGSDCAAFLSSIEPAELDPGTFSPVESGVLVPPPDLAP